MKSWRAVVVVSALLVGCQLAPPAGRTPQNAPQPPSDREAIERELAEKRAERDQIVAEMKSWESKPDSREKQDRLAALDHMKKQVENDVFRLEMRLKDMGVGTPAPTAQNPPKQDDTDAALDQALEDARQSEQALVQKPREEPKEPPREEPVARQPGQEPLPVPREPLKQEPRETPRETPLVNQAGRYDSALPFEERWADIILRVKKALEKYSE